MVPTRFTWPYGGVQVFLCTSASRWMDHYPMALMEGSRTVFQTVCNLPPGFHQYRFFVDGIWRYDESKPCVTDDLGAVNNFIIVREPGSTSVSQNGPFVPRNMDLDGDDSVSMNPSTSGMQHELIAQISDTHIEIFRRQASAILSNRTAYDMLPVSSKVTVMDAQMPVKQVFRIMFDEGLALVPIWDGGIGRVTGMLAASDYILILRELQNNARLRLNGDLDSHSIFAWKQEKNYFNRNLNGPVGLQINPLIHAFDDESLKDVALKIVRNEISKIPVFRSSTQDGFQQLINLACLPRILKYICRYFRDLIQSLPLLQQEICRLPLGTWIPDMRGGNGYQLRALQRGVPLSYALDQLVEARISSIPIVDDNGGLLDVYSRSDIMSLAKDDAYAHIRLDQMTIGQALDQVYSARPLNNGRRRCPTCLCSSSLHEIMEQLSDPVVRRLVVVEDTGSRRVLGIVSLRDVFKFILGS